jgi:hypothetical protein
MNRGCNVEHPNPRLTADRCRRCWLYVNVPRYRVAFGGPADTPPDVVAHFFPVRDCARAVKMKRKPEGCCDGTLRVVVLEAV